MFKNSVVVVGLLILIGAGKVWSLSGDASNRAKDDRKTIEGQTIGPKTFAAFTLDNMKEATKQFVTSPKTLVAALKLCHSAFDSVVEIQEKKDEVQWKKDVNTRIDTLNTTLNTRMDSLNTTLTKALQDINKKLDQINDKINFFHPLMPSPISPTELSIESVSDFADCSTTCSRLSQRRSGSFTDSAIINCCIFFYEYKSGYCNQNIPVCTDPGIDITHYYIKECDFFCKSRNTPESQIQLRNCCTLHGLPTGNCNTWKQAICSHFPSI